MTIPQRSFPATLLIAGLLLAGCGDTEPSAAAPPPSAAAPPPSAGTPGPAAPADEPADDGSVAVPAEQQLCGAVAEAPIAQVLGEEITVRAFHPPSGTGVNVSCNWETTTRSFTVKFYFQPGFRTLVDDDILAEYGEGPFDGLAVEAYRSVWPNGVIIAGPAGTAIELSSAGAVAATDDDLVAIGTAALTAAQAIYG